MDKRKLCDLALDELFKTELSAPCDEMADKDSWCEEHCRYSSPQKDCWQRYLELTHPEQ